eukprot:CAMPEP_0175872418 /NCGR_PEP_ID=MMETSP0107_2-20121207/37708_1 /TAXON_ID=195067 ORGANISM="Goniomonas pacifica, Strain CCMP1869" /NCGR_SAMPLE_ID=MMETSP0107_2 /ASSEMBLY_ACC=CAM_ASM_000203 /LENGTH=71 /DNA_ID=CAMNT_0017190963 /DNA_START=54 /DNA_END=266 /DNA_ORIENTATION=+
MKQSVHVLEANAFCPKSRCICVNLGVLLGLFLGVRFAAEAGVWAGERLGLFLGDCFAAEPGVWAGERLGVF